MKILSFIKRFWWFFVLGLLIGGGWVWWNNQSKQNTLKANSYTVKRQDLTETLSISGQIDATEKADLQFQTSGMLSWVGVKEGDYVKKFQVIASLDKKELKNQMSQLLNNYMTNRWNFEQGQADNLNWQTNGMTDAARDTIKRTLEKSQFSLNNAVLDVEAQDLTMKFANLWTPIEGIVTSIDTPVSGINVTPSSANFMVINPKSIYFSASADQTEVPSFKNGMSGKIVLDSFPDKEIDATVNNIGFVPMAGETGTVYELKIIFDPGDVADKIKMGMTGDANFVLKQIPNVLVVPEAYIKKQGNKYYVTKMINGILTKVEVVEGDTIEGDVEIKEGLNENDVIYNQP